MLYRDIARLGTLVLKLHLNTIQSPVHYYQINKNVLVAMAIEPATYVRNHNISVTLPCFILNSNDTPISTMKQIRIYDNGRVTLVRKIQNIELCMPYQYRINWLRKLPACSFNSSQKFTAGVQMKIVLGAWVSDRAGMQCSVRSSRLSTVPY